MNIPSMGIEHGNIKFLRTKTGKINLYACPLQNRFACHTIRIVSMSSRAYSKKPLETLANIQFSVILNN